LRERDKIRIPSYYNGNLAISNSAGRSEPETHVHASGIIPISEVRNSENSTVPAREDENKDVSYKEDRVREENISDAPEEMQKEEPTAVSHESSPHHDDCPDPPRHDESVKCDMPDSCPCAPEEKKGILGGILDKISTEDLLMLGLILFMTLGNSEDNIMILVMILLVVFI